MVVLRDVHDKQCVGIIVVRLQNLCCTASCGLSPNACVVRPETLHYKITENRRSYNHTQKYLPIWMVIKIKKCLIYLLVI
jgi:hypothetical protein